MSDLFDAEYEARCDTFTRPALGDVEHTGSEHRAVVACGCEYHATGGPLSLSCGGDTYREQLTPNPSEEG